MTSNIGLKKNYFNKSPFVSNVLALASGAALSQIITMAFTPVITRLYGPDAYGIQSVFLSIAATIAPIAAMTYPLAIVLPKKDNDALKLVYLSILLGIAFSLFITGLIYIYGEKILQLLHANTISNIKYFIPIFIIISVIGNVFKQWAIRKRTFSLIAKAIILQAFVINLLKVKLGLINPTATSLITTGVLGELFGAFILMLGFHKSRVTNHLEYNDTGQHLSMWAVAKKHRDFPILRAPQTLINVLSQSLPTILLATYFGPTSAGLYSIALTVLTMPSVFIGEPVMQVFYPLINETIHKGEDSKALIIKATLGLALTAGLPFLIIMIAGPTIFLWFFGAKWYTAGVYAQYLSPWLFLQCINKPAVSAIPSLFLQKGLLIYELISTGTKVLALYIGYFFYKNDIIAIALFSVTGSIAYIYLIIWVINHSRKIIKIT